MTQKPLIIANWKCNPTSQKEAGHLFGAVERGLRETTEAEVVICPPFVWLFSFYPQPAKDSRKKMSPDLGQIKLGGQDCHWENKGAYTGEVSPAMLKDLGCQYVILGHSERRRYFQETDEMINRKIKAALKAGLRPVLCIGEEVRDSFDSQGQPLNEMSLVVAEQLEKDLAGLPAARLREIVITYEPVWAISTEAGSLACSPDDAMKAALLIRKTLIKLYNRPVAEKVKIIYGGSVNSRNVADYLKGAGMDGVLVGGASLNASEFIKLIEQTVS
jgi:triosephosphate isomerase